MRSSQARKHAGHKLFLLTGGLLALANLAIATSVPAISDFDWNTVTPSTSLNYTSCYSETYKCAKLVVPLDWLASESVADLDNNNTTSAVTLALIARPATVPASDPRHGGTILVNPGGPSGSGVGFMLRASEVIQRTADSEALGRHYEILSFDPRGVGLTEPRADCYGGDEFARGTAWWTDRGLGAVGESGEDGGQGDLDRVRRAMARAKGFGRMCEGKNRGAGREGGIWGFMSTSSVARDMVAIVDKLDELRKETLAGSAATTTRTGADDEGETQQRIELRSADNDTEADPTRRIQYWGFSYGSALGNYFASMFPGKVGRVILEAVEDVNDYHSSSWHAALEDTQHVLDHFWDTCFRAGPACALWSTNDADATAIRDRVRHFLKELGAEPIPHVAPLEETNNFVAVTKHDVLEAIFHALYQPQRDFPALARLLSDAMQGNLTLLYASLNQAPTHKDSCSTHNKTEPPAYTWGPDAMTAVACGDGEPQTNLTAAAFADYVADLQRRQNADFAYLEAQVRLGCSGWRVRPRYRFDGPWTTPVADARGVRGVPAAPILFVSSRYDPVTPLANAVAMARGHPGSRVLVQENAGHGSLFSPGRCREDYIKRYFATGEVPAEGVVCKPDCQPFQDCPRMSEVGVLGVGDVARDSWGWRAPRAII
ncbi:TAP-like protein-domain-containing protein [Apiospora marii]|uniref:TAP-like protein-domain-containing protein n=1 Tax=Apiospora marii TaxID=335849 RepID=UPI0031304390